MSSLQFVFKGFNRSDAGWGVSSLPTLLGHKPKIKSQLERGVSVMETAVCSVRRCQSDALIKVTFWGFTGKSDKL